MDNLAHIAPVSLAKRKPSISVIMVTYMTGPALFGAVRAVLEDRDISELIIVDNGNTEAGRQGLCEQIIDHDHVRLIQGHGNIGFSKGCNYGAKFATSDCLLFLNPDALIAPGAAMKMAQWGQTLDRPWIAGGLIRDEHGREQRGSRRNRLTHASAFISFIGLHKLPFFESLHLETQPVPGGPAEVPIISGACMMMDRESFDEIGGFDEGYFLHVEDIDICERVRRANGTVHFIPGATAMHYGSTSHATRYQIEWQKLKGFIHYFWKFSNGPVAKLTTLLTAPLMAVAIMGRATWLTIRKAFIGH